MTHDRMQSDEFLLTQEFLAMMLGVRRTGVTAAAGALQRAGLIRYKRGNVTIIDRRGLIRRSCECYGVSKKEFDRLLGDRAYARSGPVDRVLAGHRGPRCGRIKHPLFKLRSYPKL